MCLNTVSKKQLPNTKIVVGIKDFRRHPKTGILLFQWGRHNRSRKVIIGKWIKATGRDFTEYRTGFHAYARRLWNFEIKVLLKGVRTIGRQSGRKVLVADWLYVPKDDEKIVGTKIVKVKKPG